MVQILRTNGSHIHIWQAHINIFSCGSNYKNTAVSVCCPSVYLSKCLQFSESVNKTSTEARLVPGSCTVEFKQLYMCTLHLWCCSAQPKPILASKKPEFYNSRNSCSRIVLVYDKEERPRPSFPPQWMLIRERTMLAKACIPRFLEHYMSLACRSAGLTSNTRLGTVHKGGKECVAEETLCAHCNVLPKMISGHVNQ